MNYDYESYLIEKLNILKETKGYNINLEVSTEQAFAKLKTLKPDTVYVVIKYLTSSISFEAITQPIQLLVLAEQNDLETTRQLFNDFAVDYTWKENTTFIKQQYTTPVVLSNFNEIDYGYRSIVYLTGTLYVMENIADVENLEIDGVSVTALGFSLNYSMSGNTQPLGNNEIATTVKNVASVALSLSVPMTNTALITKVVEIMSGEESGNSDFEFSFTLNGIEIEHNYKLISADFVTAPNSVPSIKLGFMR